MIQHFVCCLFVLMCLVCFFSEPRSCPELCRYQLSNTSHKPPSYPNSLSTVLLLQVFLQIIPQNCRDHVKLMKVDWLKFSSGYNSSTVPSSLSLMSVILYVLKFNLALLHLHIGRLMKYYRNE